MWQGTVVAYGALSGDFSIEIDGMNISTILRTGEIAGLYHNQGSFEDMVYQVVSGSAESQTAGVRVNMVSKDGGNRFSGEAIVTYSNEHLQRLRRTIEANWNPNTNPALRNRNDCP